MDESRYRARFEDDGWESPAPGMRFLRRSNGPVELRLVEVLQSATHPEWCEIGHGGCVIEGVLEVELENEALRFEAGDAILLPPGKEHRHRPRAVTPRVRLALVDYSSESAP